MSILEELFFIVGGVSFCVILYVGAMWVVFRIIKGRW